MDDGGAADEGRVREEDWGKGEGREHGPAKRRMIRSAISGNSCTAKRVGAVASPCTTQQRKLKRGGREAGRVERGEECVWGPAEA